VLRYIEKSHEDYNLTAIGLRFNPGCLTMDPCFSMAAFPGPAQHSSGARKDRIKRFIRAWKVFVFDEILAILQEGILWI
jgi:hypothetical protein